MGYRHMRCKCGGIIGMYNRENFTCDKCGMIYFIHGNYDILLTNEKTGWIFPMIREVKE